MTFNTPSKIDTTSSRALSRSLAATRCPNRLPRRYFVDNPAKDREFGFNVLQKNISPTIGAPSRKTENRVLKTAVRAGKVASEFFFCGLSYRGPIAWFVLNVD